MMAERVERLEIEYAVDLLEEEIRVDYTPVAGGKEVPRARGLLSRHFTQEPRLATRCKALLRALAGRCRADLEIDGQSGEVPSEIDSLRVYLPRRIIFVNLTEHGLPAGYTQLTFDLLTPAQERLLDSVNASIDRMAWEDLRARLRVGKPDTRQPQVFISYRAGHDNFAEALAKRLGQEGIVPWFDKWEILAGDSIPGKIEEGLRDSIAFIPVITADYQEGKWATDELQSAITKRIEEGYRIVPVLLDSCERPELIRHLRYVDLSAQDPETFEARFAELIDGIYGLELNPFR
jgi:hypothetical protein